MSGYFDRLVARHRDEPPSVRPRPLPRLSWPGARQDVPAASRAAEWPRLDRREPATPEPSVQRAPSHVETRPLEERPVAPRAEAVFTEPRVGIRRDDREQSPAPPTPRAPVAAPPAIDVATSRVHREPPGDPDPPPTGPADVLSSLETMAAAPPVSLREPIVHATRLAAPVQEPRAQAPAGPDIVRVHIGRVDVRAVLPPAEGARGPRKRDGARAEALTLEQYLAGKRRP